VAATTATFSHAFTSGIYNIGLVVTDDQGLSSTVSATGTVVVTEQTLQPTWTQRSPANSPPARYLHAMAYDAARGQIVMFGGNPFSSSGFPAADTWVWNGTNWIQKNPPNVPPGRYGETIVYDAAHGQVVMFGGVSLGAGVVLCLIRGFGMERTGPRSIRPTFPRHDGNTVCLRCSP